MVSSRTSARKESTWPRLVSDVGGTNARFAIEVSPQELDHIDTLPTADYDSLHAAIRAYLEKAGDPIVRHAAIAIANPVVGDWVQMTNHHWAFSIETTRQALELETLIVLNDFTAQALAMPHIPKRELLQVGGTAPVEGTPIAVIGPGTGLGVSGLIPGRDGTYTALAGEGGHVSFSPFDHTEIHIWQYANRKYGHVSAERFLSGAGLTLIHEALADREGIERPKLGPAEISKAALSGTSPLARLSLDIFCAMLGTVSSNLALTLGARGGVYLCGGIIPRFIDYFITSPFRNRFESKGRFEGYLAAIPVYIVLAKHPGLLGAAVALSNAIDN